MGSLPSLEADLGGGWLSELEEMDDVEHSVDLELWGTEAVRRFGYILDQVIGKLADGEAVHGGGTRVTLWRATRISDGREVIVKGVVSSGELPRAAKQELMSEFRVLHALRGEAVLAAEALLCTRFDAWLVLDCTTGPAVQACLERGGPFGTPAASELFVQLLQALTHLAQGAASRDEAAAGRQARGCECPSASVTGSDAGSSCLTKASSSSQGAQPKRGQRADVWAPALRSYDQLWGSLPQYLQEQAVASVMKSEELLTVMVPDGTSATLLKLFRQCQAVDLRVRPAAADILKLSALVRA